MNTSSSRSHQEKTSNILNAASPLQNYEFDFGLGTSLQKGRAGVATLKDQKFRTANVQIGPTTTGNSSSLPIRPTTPSTPTSTKPLGSFPVMSPLPGGTFPLGTAAGPSAATETVVLAPTNKVHAGFKEKPAYHGPTSSARAGGQPTPSWGSVLGTGASVSPGSSQNAKEDVFASLWTSVSATTKSSAAVDFSAAVLSPSRPSPSPSTIAPSDPFSDLFGGSGGASLSGMKTKSETAHRASPSVCSPSSSASFDMDPLWAGLPSKPAPVPKGEGLTPGPTPMPSPMPRANQFAQSFAAFPSSLNPSTATTFPSSSNPPLPHSGPVDPFAASVASTASTSEPVDPFAAFNATAPAASSQSSMFGDSDPFETAFGAASQADSVPARQPPADSAGANSFDSFDSFFAMPVKAEGSTTTSQPKAPLDPLEALFMKPSSAPAAAPSGGDFGNDLFGGAQEGSWGSFEDSAGPTRELDGLPPPPAGLSVLTALEKGGEFYRGGQFADAIKWFVWAEQLCAKEEGDGRRKMFVETLSKRASCYKEAGEMKKAVADCTTVLELEPANVAVLMQRAILYEGMEKYKLGVEDLRQITRLDPSNRPAMTLLSRLSKLVAL